MMDVNNKFEKDEDFQTGALSPASRLSFAHMKMSGELSNDDDEEAPRPPSPLGLGLPRLTSDAEREAAKQQKTLCLQSDPQDQFELSPTLKALGPAGALGADSIDLADFLLNSTDRKPRRDKPALALNLSLIGALMENTESAELTMRELEARGAELKAELNRLKAGQEKHPECQADIEPVPKHENIPDKMEPMSENVNEPVPEHETELPAAKDPELTLVTMPSLVGDAQELAKQLPRKSRAVRKLEKATLPPEELEISEEIMVDFTQLKPSRRAGPKKKGEKSAKQNKKAMARVSKDLDAELSRRLEYNADKVKQRLHASLELVMAGRPAGMRQEDFARLVEMRGLSGMPPLRTGKTEAISTLTSGCVGLGLNAKEVSLLLDENWEQMAMVTECSLKNAGVENSLYRAVTDNINRLEKKHPDRTFFERAWEKLVGTDKPAPPCCDDLKPPYFVCRSCTTNLSWGTPENLQLCAEFETKKTAALQDSNYQQAALLKKSMEAIPTAVDLMSPLIRLVERERSRLTEALSLDMPLSPSQMAESKSQQKRLTDFVFSSMCKRCDGSFLGSCGRVCYGCGETVDTDGDCQLWSEHVSKCKPMERLLAAAEFQRGVEETVAQLEKLGTVVPTVLCVHQPFCTCCSELVCTATHVLAV